MKKIPDPLPEGATHVPSPRQNVVAEAPVPELRLVTGRLPVTSDANRTVNVLLAPAIVLFVNVSVVARATRVSVAVGRVSVPVLTILEKPGVTSVGLVANTRAPLPVSSVTVALRLADVGVARKVAIPVARPVRLATG